jgi:pyruvate,water dikinase
MYSGTSVFTAISAGFSIRSNDLTRLIPGGAKMMAEVIAVCRSKCRKIDFCGQAPSDYADFAQFLIDQEIDSISLNPDTVAQRAS